MTERSVAEEVRGSVTEAIGKITADGAVKAQGEAQKRQAKVERSGNQPPPEDRDPKKP